ncbi:MAG: type II secretion system protein M [bacterium]|nr:type II secretion system protein M [bacterium]MCP5067912.1 type II secretion system protein M [bacterium]
MKGLWNRITDAWTEFSTRERALVGGAGAALAAAIFYLAIIGPALDLAAGARQRAVSAEEQLRAVQALRARYDRIDAPLRQVRDRITGGAQGEIFTTLEALARESAVKVASMEPRTSPASDAYEETKVQVVLKSQTLAQVVNYLHRIESATHLLSIKTLRIRTRADKPELLDVTFTVSSFEPIKS